MKKIGEDLKLIDITGENEAIHSNSKVKVESCLLKNPIMDKSNGVLSSFNILI